VSELKFNYLILHNTIAEVAFTNDALIVYCFPNTTAEIGVSDRAVTEAQNLVAVSKLSDQYARSGNSATDFRNVIGRISSKSRLLFLILLISNNGLLNTTIGQDLNNEALAVSQSYASTFIAHIIINRLRS
jgi:hypothetical protein